MTVDRSDEYLEWIAEDERREVAVGNGRHPDDAGPSEPASGDVKRQGDECGSGATHLRERLLTVTGLEQLPVAEPLIDGLLYRGTLAQLAAGPGSYKSFAGVGLCCALATGRDWEGHAVPKARNVIYVAAEGASGMRARIHAWREYHGVSPCELDDRLFILPCPAQLRFPDVDQIIELAQELDVGLVVLDTRARCTVGIDENSATEQGVAIAQAGRIVGATDATVLVIHHTSRNGGAGRGSNAWDGAVWSDLRMEGSSLAATITCEKHKDAPSQCEHHFVLVEHTVSDVSMPGVDERLRRTLVFVQGGAFDGLRLDNRVDKFVHALVHDSAPPEGFTASQIIEMAKDAGHRRSAVYESLKRLRENGAIVHDGKDRGARYRPASKDSPHQNDNAKSGRPRPSGRPADDRVPFVRSSSSSLELDVPDEHPNGQLEITDSGRCACGVELRRPESITRGTCAECDATYASRRKGAKPE